LQVDGRCHIPLDFVIENLWDAETGEEAHDIALLAKILTNIVQNPTEPKFRRVGFDSSCSVLVLVLVLHSSPRSLAD
jgi:hypothetical protein